MENTIQILKQTSDGLVFDTKLLFNTLDSIGDRNISIVSITGKQNSGKSLLLNHFVRSLKRNESNKTSGYFSNLNVCHNQTHESGIWMCSEPFVVTADDGSEIVLLLMEARINSEEHSYLECGVIFAINLLLSSTLILNIQNNVTEDAMKFVEQFTLYAQSMNDKTKSDLFQRMIFLVRDWDNETSYLFGIHDNIKPGINNYMKNMINPNTNHSADGRSTRQTLLACFNSVSCYLMPHPGKHMTKSIHLIDRQFREKMQEFVSIIVRDIEPKTIDGHKLTGIALKHNINKWQAIISDHKFERKMQCQTSRATDLEITFQNAFDLYETKIRSCIESKPTDDEFLTSHNNAEEECWENFGAMLDVSDSDDGLNKMLDRLRATISDRFQYYRNKNLERFKEEEKHCTYNIPCVARSVRPIDAVSQKPNNVIVLELPCPGSFNGTCDREDQFWFCSVCKNPLEYGLNGYFYCKCGKADAYYYEFKCNSKNHTSNYLRFIDNHLKRLLSNKEINILILGETGVGKSTWINGFANYLTYPSLAEAKQNELLSLIASSFTITDTNYKRRVITCGENMNEVFKTGQSATQDPKSYVFDCENKLIRIIDTPGIGDTRGIDQDKKNFDAILRYLTNLDKLHGICILLKPNNARLGVMFRFCIKELLTHLHRDASRNIVFCFTNARSTFYRPGDTFPALMSLLQENKVVDIKLCKDTVYCMDNESFRFLCAYHHGIEFDEEEYNFAKSWDKSVKEINRMLDYICGLVPHSFSNTLSIKSKNYTRKVIICLTKPLADITKNILLNINVVEDKRLDILKTEKREKRHYKNKQMRDRVDLQIQEMEQFVKELNEEKDMITKISAKFGGFLKANSIVPYNDALGEYLDVLIRMEKDKVSAGGDRKTLDGLEQMKKDYNEEVRLLDMYMTDGKDEQLTTTDMNDLVNKLYSLKHKGKELKQIMQVMAASKLQNARIQ